MDKDKEMSSLMLGLRYNETICIGDEIRIDFSKEEKHGYITNRIKITAPKSLRIERKPKKVSNET